MLPYGVSKARQSVNWWVWFMTFSSTQQSTLSSICGWALSCALNHIAKHSVKEMDLLMVCPITGNLNDLSTGFLCYQQQRNTTDPITGLCESNPSMESISICWVYHDLNAVSQCGDMFSVSHDTQLIDTLCVDSWHRCLPKMMQNI